MRGKAQEPVPISFLHKKFKPIGACSGYSRASLFLPGHLIPATFFNDFSSLPATYFPEFFEFRFMVRLLHKLGDADRRLTRQDRLVGHRAGSAGGCPATPCKADDHCDDCPTNKAPHSILNLRCTLWLHCQDLLHRDFRYGAIPPLMAASTERTVPSVNSFTVPDTLTAVRLADPGAAHFRRSLYGPPYHVGCHASRSMRPRGSSQKGAASSGSRPIGA